MGLAKMRLKKKLKGLFLNLNKANSKKTLLLVTVSVAFIGLLTYTSITFHSLKSLLVDSTGIYPLLSKVEMLINFSLLSSIFVIFFVVKQNKTNAVFSKKAYTDNLTGAYNRDYLEAFFNKENIDDFVFVMLDIDHFKRINDTYGHDIGDVVLRDMTYEINRVIRSGIKDRIIRLGGEEFLLLINLPAIKGLGDDVIRTVERVRNAVKKLQFDNGRGGVLQITASYGVNFATSRCSNVDEAIAFADKALYKAKADRDCIVAFEASNLREHDIDFRKIERLVNAGKLLCYYQPIVNLKTSQIVKFEALVRLEDDSGTIYTPGNFLHMVNDEKTKLRIVSELFEYNSKVLEKYKGMNISINLSLDEIYNDSIFEYIIGFKHLSAHSAGRIELELLNVDSASNIDLLEERLITLKKLGYKITVDDFGAKYSRIMHLLETCVDEIKIDGSIIKSLKHGNENKDHIRSVVRTAAAHNVLVTASHIESKDIESALLAMGVEQGQGFYLGKPIRM